MLIQADTHKTCQDQILSQVLGFRLKSEFVFGLKLVSYSQNSREKKISLRFGLKLKTGTQLSQIFW